MRFRTIGAFVIVAACIGCSDRPEHAWVVVDSVGVKVVTSDPNSSLWSGTLEPVLTLGTVDQGGPTEFFRVRDLEFLDSTAFAVANAGSEEVRVFGLGGEFQRAFGKPGNGPAEFRDLRMVRTFADSIVTYDQGNARMAMRDYEGNLLRSFKLDWYGGALFPVDLSASGQVLAVTARYMTELTGTGRVVDTSLVSLYDLQGALLDSVGRLPHNERFVKQVGDYRTTVLAPFAAEASLVSIDSGFCYAFGPHTEVRCYDIEGSLTRIARVDIPARPVAEADVQEYWDDLWEEAEGEYREVMQGVRDDLTFPTHFPAISKLVVDDEGQIWARRFRKDSTEEDRWWVFAAGGLVGQLTSPRRFEVLDVENGLVGGVWRDQLEVEHVRVYRLSPN